MRKTKVSAEEKLNTVLAILDGAESLSQAALRLSVHFSTIQGWIGNFKGNGSEAFVQTGNKYYSRRTKVQAVLAYLNGEGSLLNICERFNIKSTKQLQQWIKKYNSHEELNASGSGGSLIMTKGRKTTFDERVEIVQYCIAHDHNYSETAEKYHISYHQARNYTVKYEAGGVEALQDKRGKRKPENELTEVEKLRAELKLERTLREQAEMEASFLKKLAEIERRWK